jgi:hypothetical protein
VDIRDRTGEHVSLEIFARVHTGPNFGDGFRNCGIPTRVVRIPTLCKYFTYICITGAVKV